MDYEMFDRVASTISFKNPPFPMKFTWDAWNEGVKVHLRFEVPDRDTGELLWVTHTEVISSPLWKDDREMARYLRHWLLKCYIHEFQEALHVDGVRVEDPHKEAA